MLGTKGERIRKAIAAVRARGYEVRGGSFGVVFHREKKIWVPRKSAKKCLCPLGALVLVEGRELGTASACAVIMKLLDVSAGWVLCFSWTFDTGGDACHCEACKLGLALRKEMDAPS
jgi:hypothetical protein